MVVKRRSIVLCAILLFCARSLLVDLAATASATATASPTPAACPVSPVPTATPTSTATISVIQFAPAVVMLNNPTMPGTSTGSDSFRLEFNAFDNSGKVIYPTDERPLFVQI